MKDINEIISGLDDVIARVKENGNIEDVVNKTRVYAKKSAEAIEISRKKIELLDAKTKLAKTYEKYGKLCFAASQGEDGNEEAIEKTSQEIIMLKSQCEFLEEEIEAFKQMIQSEVDAQMSQSKKEDDIVVDDVEVVEVTED